MEIVYHRGELVSDQLSIMEKMGKYDIVNIKIWKRYPPGLCKDSGDCILTETNCTHLVNTPRY
jgi:hypothetical protein